MITKSESNILTIFRVIAMSLIVLCHYVGWLPRISVLGQFLNIGVPIFFIISGYIYGQKQIDNPKSWIIYRLITLSVPIYVFLVLSFLALVAIGKLGKVDLLDSILAILHLIGIFDCRIGNIITGPLWFITFIIICYLITPILQKINLEIKPLIALIALGILIDISLMLAFGSKGYLAWIPGIFCYTIAYWISGHWNKTIPNSTVIILIPLVIVALSLRLGAKFLLDGTRLYDLVIVPYTQCFAAFGLFFILYWIISRIELSEKAIALFRKIGSYSFEIYIVHGCLIQGPLSFSHISNSIIINTLLLIPGIIALAILVKQISKPIIKMLLKNNLSAKHKLTH